MVVCDVCGAEMPPGVKECQVCQVSQEKPYYRKRLEAGKVRDQFTVELNSQERAWLEILKARLDFNSDSKVIKLCLENAIISNNLSLTESTWRYVLSVKRQRLSNFKVLPEPSINENAKQI